jgi:CRISPR-associated endonuclease Csn1
MSLRSTLQDFAPKQSYYVETVSVGDTRQARGRWRVNSKLKDLKESMLFRLALDLGAKSIGWALIRLNSEKEPVTIIKAGARIFSDGRDTEGTSLAVTRRNARAMRRTRDRKLKRKNRIITLLIDLGFFPSQIEDRRKLETLNPFELRVKGLQEPLSPAEFGRALFHINQRRGFKSNRKTDKKDNDAGALKSAIKTLRDQLNATGENGMPRTVGELLYRRFTDTSVAASHRTVRARYRELRVQREDGKFRVEKSYDLYIDRKMIEDEFDLLWSVQNKFNATLYSDSAGAQLKDCLLFQRPLRPVRPGRCTLMPEEERAPLALPSTQRFRIYQELNNLKILLPSLSEQALTIAQRNKLAAALDKSAKVTFTQIKKLLGLPGATLFNLQDAKRQELKGNGTSAALSKPSCFGKLWPTFSSEMQDLIVSKLLTEENESVLIEWLVLNTQVAENAAEEIINTSLPEGYGSLCRKALSKILPALMNDVIPYSTAVITAGFSHHSKIDASATGEIFDSLPYYGEALSRHVAFGSGVPDDPIEKRLGKIANPTVHIGLNQVRLLVNAIIKRYGHPSQVIIEVTRDLKQSREQKAQTVKQQADNQNRNTRIREDVAGVLQISASRVSRQDIQKWILWEELSSDVANRRCPYSGVQISPQMLLSEQVEIEHILPFSRTLDDSLNNKTVSMRQANRVKGNSTPWEAFGKSSVNGFSFAEILQRAEGMKKSKRYRFAEDGYEQWLKEDKDFLARALNDTSYLSRIAREYVSLICPQDTRVIPGRLTGMLRAKFGLNDVLGLSGEKNRNDHRHHAVDACVIGVTDRAMLKAFSSANASARAKQVDRLVENMPLPWATYFADVQRAIRHIYVSHKPDHGHEGALHNSTAYRLIGDGFVGHHKMIDGKRQFVEEKLKVIEFAATGTARHGFLENGEPAPYKGYKGDSNYCIEIVKNEKGKWEGEVLTTFEANAIVRELGEDLGVKRLRNLTLSQSNKPLVMRLLINDTVRLNVESRLLTMRVVTIKGSGQILMAEHQEANSDARNRNQEDAFGYTSKTAGSLQKSQGRQATISPIGVVSDKGFSG